jgi:transposase InsO family protein
MIKRHGTDYSIRRLCDLVHVSASGYYAWRNRTLSRRARENEILLAEIRQVHKEVDGRYGSPRMHAELVDRGYRCSENRVARLMRQHGIAGRQRKKHLGSRFHDARGKAPNRLNRQFAVAAANRVWAADVTYLRTAEGFVYLAVVLDLYSRRVVGWAMRSRLGSDLVGSALRQALSNRQPDHGIMHHSDQDGLYACAAYYDLLTEHGFVVSNSRKGNCLDNACVESFFARLKTECLPPTRFMNRDQAELEVFNYVEVFYNRVRRHSTLGYHSPVDFELMNNQP